MARIDRECLTKNGFDLIRATGDSIQLGERQTRADGFWVHLECPFEGFLRQVDLAARHLENTHVPVETGPLRFENRGLLAQLDSALEIFETGERVAKKDERGDILRIRFQSRARACFCLLVLPCHQQEIPRLQLDILVVRETVGGPQKLRIGAPKVVVLHIRLGKLQMRLSGPGRIRKGDAVREGRVVVLLLGKVTVALRDVAVGQDLGIACTGERTKSESDKDADATGAHDHDLEEDLGYEQTALRATGGTVNLSNCCSEWP